MRLIEDDAIPIDPEKLTKLGLDFLLEGQVIIVPLLFRFFQDSLGRELLDNLVVRGDADV